MVHFVSVSLDKPIISFLTPKDVVTMNIDGTKINTTLSTHPTHLCLKFIWVRYHIV